MLLLFACTEDPIGTDSAADSPGPGDSPGDSRTDSPTDSEPVDTGPWEPAEGCPEAEDVIQEIDDRPAGPYRILHPIEDDHAGPIVIFLPGGNGSREGSMGTWANFFDGDPRGYRIVMPYDTTGDYPSTAPDVGAILDDVLACFGGDPDRVHLAGHSNGGWLVYNDVGREMAARVRTISGLPGYFQSFDADDWAGLAFHNAAGEDDADWRAAMEDAHERLTDAGIDSQLTIWPDTGHTPGPDWDGREGMFAFWDAWSG